VSERGFFSCILEPERAEVAAAALEMCKRLSDSVSGATERDGKKRIYQFPYNTITFSNLTCISPFGILLAAALMAEQTLKVRRATMK
jgi:hypothetical protein